MGCNSFNRVADVYVEAAAAAAAMGSILLLIVVITLWSRAHLRAHVSLALNFSMAACSVLPKNKSCALALSKESLACLPMVRTTSTLTCSRSLTGNLEFFSNRSKMAFQIRCKGSLLGFALAPARRCSLAALWILSASSRHPRTVPGGTPTSMWFQRCVSA
jgi:hypothetical protein